MPRYQRAAKPRGASREIFPRPVQSTPPRGGSAVDLLESLQSRRPLGDCAADRAGRPPPGQLRHEPPAVPRSVVNRECTPMLAGRGARGRNAQVSASGGRGQTLRKVPSRSSYPGRKRPRPGGLRGGPSAENKRHRNQPVKRGDNRDPPLPARAAQRTADGPLPDNQSTSKQEKERGFSRHLRAETCLRRRRRDAGSRAASAVPPGLPGSEKKL